MANAFRNLLMSIHKMPLEVQKTALDNALEEWKGPEEQVDDILVMGVRIN